MNVSLFTAMKAVLILGVGLWLGSTASFVFYLYNLVDARPQVESIQVVKEFGKFLGEKKDREFQQFARGSKPSAPKTSVSDSSVAPLEAPPVSEEPSLLIESYLANRVREKDVADARQALGGDAPILILALAVANKTPLDVTTEDIEVSQAAMIEIRRHPNESRENMERALRKIEGFSEGEALEHVFREIVATL